MSVGKYHEGAQLPQEKPSTMPPRSRRIRSMDLPTPVQSDREARLVDAVRGLLSNIRPLKLDGPPIRKVRAALAAYEGSAPKGGE